ncbi:hypothetical protein [Flavobacterium sp. LC2016-12]|nr:hypothetical protein [Flavobacterium sp. LC2016-12]
MSKEIKIIVPYKYKNNSNSDLRIQKLKIIFIGYINNVNLC